MTFCEFEKIRTLRDCILFLLKILFDFASCRNVFWSEMTE